MIVCPDCGWINREGLLVCDQCASYFDSTVDDWPPSSPLDTEQLPSTEPASKRNPREVAFEVLDMPMAGPIQFPPGRRFYHLGRATEDTIVDVDFDYFDAGKHGISRRHARMFWYDNAWWIVDLASTNGTFLNGQYLSPNECYLLQHGDHLRLGELDIRLYMQTPHAVEARANS